MRHASRVAISCFFLILSPFWGYDSNLEAKINLQGTLNQQVSGYEDWGDFPIMLGHLAQKYQLPMGVDLEIPLKVKLTSVRLSQGTVSGVLTALVSQEPDYDWSVADSVINVKPRGRIDTILDIQVKRFRVTNADTFKVHDAILNLPEVKTWLAQKQVTEETAQGGSILVGANGGTGLPLASVDLHNLTLREILNTIIRSSQLNSWRISRWGDRGQYLSVSVT